VTIDDERAEERDEIIDIEGDRGFMHDHDEREALRERVRGIEVEEPQSTAASIEERVRRGLDAVQAMLQIHRGQREKLNAQIKELVDEETILKRAVHVFDRWHRDQADEGGDDE
jgi:hypothetical protein